MSHGKCVGGELLLALREIREVDVIGAERARSAVVAERAVLRIAERQLDQTEQKADTTLAARVLLVATAACLVRVCGVERIVEAYQAHLEYHLGTCGLQISRTIYSEQAKQLRLNEKQANEQHTFAMAATTIKSRVDGNMAAASFASRISSNDSDRETIVSHVLIRATLFVEFFSGRSLAFNH